MEMLKQGDGLHTWYEDINLWPSVYSGIQAIINRTTPCHRNSGAAAPVFDLLVSAGTHRSAAMTLGDILVHPGFIHLYFLFNLINHLFCPHVLFLKQIQVLHKAILSRNCCTWIMWTGFSPMAEIKNISFSI